MKNDRLIEVFERIKYLLVNEEESKDSYLTMGICNILYYMAHTGFVSAKEFTFIKKYLRKNKPSYANEYQEFTQNKFWWDSVYWWDRMCDKPETKQIRIDYLTKLISNIK